MGSIRWLHVSDLHFCEKNPRTDLVMDRLLDDVGAFERPDFVLCTGDIAYRGIRAEYQMAVSFFARLIDQCTVPRDRVFFVPGNHDIDRSRKVYCFRGVRELQGHGEFDTFLGSEEREDLAQRWAAYRDFVLEVTGRETRSYGDVWQLDLDSATIGILALNTAWLSGNDREKGSLAIGGRRLRELLVEMRSAFSEADVLLPQITLGLLHHPFEWLSETDRLDTEATLFLECDFLLHGHRHTVGVWEQRNPDTHAVVIGAGASQMPGGPDASQGNEHRYMWVELDPESLAGKIEFRVYSPLSGGFFAPDTGLYPGTDGTVEIPHSPGRSQASKEPVVDAPSLAHRVSRLRTLIADQAARTPLFLGRTFPGTWTEEGRESTVASGYVPLEIVDQHEAARVPNAPRLAPFEVFLADELKRQFAISGGPGSGKTTLLRFLEAYLAERDLFTPIFVSLRSFIVAPDAPPGPEDLLEALGSRLRRLANDRDLEAHLLSTEQLRAGGLALLFDGLDEVERDTADALLKAIYELTVRFPRLLVVITGRPLGWRDRALPETYRRFELQELSDDAVQTYLSGRLSSEPSSLQLVQETLSKNIRLGALARNPLLLSMICASFEESPTSDPITNRSDLYALCTQRLIDRLYDPLASVRAKHESERTIDLLKEVAYRFYLWQEADFPVDQIGPMALRVGHDQREFEGLLGLVERQSGLIQRSTDGYCFIHRSLWEYFTALACLDRPVGALIRQAANPDWEEVVRLHVGLAARQSSSERFGRLVEQIWIINKPLGVRVASEVQAAARIVQKLLHRSEGNTEQLLLIDALEQSLELLPSSEHRRVIDETLETLFIDCRETDCEVLYRAQRLLERRQIDPLSPADGLVYALLDLGHAQERQEAALADPETAFVWISVPGGAGQIGHNDKGHDNERPSREVHFTDFEMSKHPVTYWLAQGFGLGRTPKAGEVKAHEEQLPLTSVTWYEAFYLAMWLDCRLPTEQEWEYAARGGPHAKPDALYFFGDDPAELVRWVWNNDPIRVVPHRVSELDDEGRERTSIPWVSPTCLAIPGSGPPTRTTTAGIFEPGVRWPDG